MLPFESPPATPIARAAPAGRGLGCWPALLPAVALALDAAWPLPSPTSGPGLLWLDLAAVVCLAWAIAGRGRARRTEWNTPVDGPVLAGMVLAVLHVVRMGGDLEPVQWLRQITASGVCFYSLSARLRREPRAPDAIWPAFALVVLALSVFVLAAATHGAPALQQAIRGVDERWVSRSGLAKALLLGTILCAGRAAESGARALWRVTALVGAVAFVLCTFVGGSGLGIASLASLDEPFYFGTSVVAMLFLASLARMAWALSRDRADEAWRWRAAAVAFPVIAALLIFGGTTGGEGLRTIAGLAGAAVVASRIAPRAARVAPATVPAAAPPASAAA